MSQLSVVESISCTAPYNDEGIAIQFRLSEYGEPQSVMMTTWLHAIAMTNEQI